MRLCARCALLAATFAAPVLALDIRVTRPAPTLEGDPTSFSAVVSDAAGTAQIRWDFGDGTVTEFSPDGTTAEHDYASPGHYSVTVVAEDEGGFASTSFIHTVHTAPTVGQPQSSSPLLLDAERSLVITANTDSGTVTLVDADDPTQLVELEVFTDPVALALAPDGRLWVLHRETYAILIIDLDERRAVEFFRLPYASLPTGLVFSPDGDAYVTLAALGEVARIDGVTHEIESRVHVAPFLRGIAISGDGASLWVTRFLSVGDHGEVYELDPETLAPARRYDLAQDTTTEDSDVQGRGLPNYLFSVTVSPDGRRAWVPAKKDNMSRGLERDGLDLTQDSTVRPLVSILDLELGQEIESERIDLDDRNLPVHVTMTPLGDWAFISLFGSNLVDVRDVYDGSFRTTLSTDELHGPVATVLSSDQRLFVLAELGRRLVVFDVADVLSGVDLATRVVADIPLVARETLSTEVLLGKRIFSNAEDKRMASEGYLSCASCHFDGFEDGLVWDFTGRGEGFRNTTSLLGRRGTGHGRVHWSGNFDEIQDFENPIRQNQAGLGFMTLEAFEQGTRSQPLGDPKTGHSAELDALAAYVTSLDRIPPSPWRQADGTLTNEASAGREIFLSLGCDECHAGPDFTDSSGGVLHDVGTLTELSGGRLGEELTGIDTPTLLGLWQTAPYLHDGSAPALRDVLVTRNPAGLHGDTASLSEAELGELVSYLEQIDQERPLIDLVLPEPPLPGGLGGGAGAPSGSGGAETGGASAGGSSGGNAPSAGAGGMPGPGSMPPGEDGCGCNVPGRARNSRVGLVGTGLLLAFALWRRRALRLHSDF